jgi:hypothetical protein
VKASKCEMLLVEFSFVFCIDRSFAFGSFFFDTLRIYGFWLGKKLHVDFLPLLPLCFINRHIHGQSGYTTHIYIHTSIDTNSFIAFNHVNLTLTVTPPYLCEG